MPCHLLYRDVDPAYLKSVDIASCVNDSIGDGEGIGGIVSRVVSKFGEMSFEEISERYKEITGGNLSLELDWIQKRFAGECPKKVISDNCFKERSGGRLLERGKRSKRKHRKTYEENNELYAQYHVSSVFGVL